jgi:hypothetical protein
MAPFGTVCVFIIKKCYYYNVSNRSTAFTIIISLYANKNLKYVTSRNLHTPLLLFQKFLYQNYYKFNSILYSSFLHRCASIQTL